MNLLLTIFAYIMVAILTPFGLVHALFRGNTKKYFRNFAIALDQLGNVTCQHLLNDVMIHDGSYKFGNPDETVSSVLGKNKLMGNLTMAGRWLCRVLNKIESDHVENAIEKDEQ